MDWYILNNGDDYKGNKLKKIAFCESFIPNSNFYKKNDKVKKIIEIEKYRFIGENHTLTSHHHITVYKIHFKFNFFQTIEVNVCKNYEKQTEEFNGHQIFVNNYTLKEAIILAENRLHEYFNNWLNHIKNKSYND